LQIARDGRQEDSPQAANAEFFGPDEAEGRSDMLPRRRLSAIMHADLAGYTRLMEGGEDRTVGHLKSVRADIWRPAIEQAGGRAVNIEGDSVLAEFESAIAAVASAIDIQERMAHFNSMLEEDQRLMFRIGVHLGEVIVDQETRNIFGDGVNVAARIQAMAEPGGIAVSRAVRDVTELQVEYAFVDGGEHQAKNVSRAVQIFHVQPRTGAATRTTTSVVPRRVLRFRGTLAGRKYGFEVPLDRVMGRNATGLVIGRSLDHCDLVLSHSTVSRRHARLMFAGGALQIEDLKSTNGTAVNGVTVLPGQPQPLQIGSTLKIGDIELTAGGE
jgi:adenylate cyclase